jgi:hypothetical protein
MLHSTSSAAALVLKLLLLAALAVGVWDLPRQSGWLANTSFLLPPNAQAFHAYLSSSRCLCVLLHCDDAL